jgi:surface antigen
MSCACSQKKPEYRPGDPEPIIPPPELATNAGVGEVPPAPTGGAGFGTGVVVGLVVGVIGGGVLGMMLLKGLEEEDRRKSTLARRRAAGYAY